MKKKSQSCRLTVEATKAVPPMGEFFSAVVGQPVVSCMEVDR